MIDDEKLPMLPAGFNIRPAAREDAQGLVDMYNLCDKTDGTHWSGSLPDVMGDFDVDHLVVEKDTRVVTAPDRQVVAAGWVYPPKHNPHLTLSTLWGEVHPGFRRLGIGAFLLAWMVERSQEILAEEPDKLPRLMRTIAPEKVTGRMVLMRNLGFHPARYFYRMQRSFEQPIPAVDLPEGFRLVHWSPGFDEAARMVINAAFSDHWASGPMSPDDWKQVISLDGTFKPQYTWLAAYGEEVAGVCINRVLDIDNANKGLHAGWIGTLGVKRAYRGQGLGKALLVASMQAFAEDGYTAAGLSVDTENPTGALRLYESLGFTPVSREIHFVREI